MSERELLKDSDQIQDCKEEIIDKLGAELEVVALRYGREPTSHALRKLYSDFANNRVLNPYPIDDEQFEEMVEMTEGNRISVDGMSKTEVAKMMKQLYENADGETRDKIHQLYGNYGDHAIYAYIDLTFSDLLVDERDEIVETAYSALVKVMEDG